MAIASDDTLLFTRTADCDGGEFLPPSTTLPTRVSSYVPKDEEDGECVPSEEVSLTLFCRKWCPLLGPGCNEVIGEGNGGAVLWRGVLGSEYADATDRMVPGWLGVGDATRDAEARLPIVIALGLALGAVRSVEPDTVYALADLGGSTGDIPVIGDDLAVIRMGDGERTNREGEATRRGDRDRGAGLSRPLRALLLT